MSLKVYCGPFQPSLENAFLRRLQEAAPGPGRAVFVVAPSQALADRLQRLVALENGRTYLNLRFHTFFSLAMDILREDKASSTVLADDFFYDKLIDGLLHKAGRSFRPSRRLAQAFRESLRDLDEAGVSANDVLSHLDDVDKAGLDKNTLRLLLELLGRFRAERERLNVLPFYGAALAAARHVKETGSSLLDSVQEIMYYGFYDLTGAQAELLSAVVERCAVSVFFPYRAGHPAFKFADRFYELKLHQGGAAPVHLPPETQSRALGPALDALFSPESSGKPAPEALTVIHASGRRDVLWRTAKEILNLRSQGVEFRDMGIVARTLEPYRAALRDVFQENEIPLAMPVGGPLVSHPLAKAAADLLTLRRREFPADTVRDLAASPFLAAAASRHGRRTRHWLQALERLRIHSGWLQWEGKLRRPRKEGLALSSRAEDEVSQPPRIPAEDVESLAQWLESLKEDLNPDRVFSSWADMTAHAVAVLSRYLRPTAHGRAQTAWRDGLAAVQRLAQLDRLNLPPRWDDFLDAAEEALAMAREEASGGADGVRALDAMDARGESFKVLFFIGLEEGVFPRQVEEDPLLRDPLRDFLQQPGGYWILPKLAGYDEEKLLFYLMAAAASERLIAVHQRSDDEGKTSVPSVYLRELCRAAGLDFDAMPQEHVPRPSLEKWTSCAPENLTPKELSTLLAGRGESPVSLWQALPPALLPEGVHPRALRLAWNAGLDLRRAGPPGPRDGLVGRPRAFLQRLAVQGLSASGMNSFATCPFQFFAGRVLGLGEPEAPVERGLLPSQDRGLLYHRVLQHAYTATANDGFWDKPADTPWQPYLNAALDEILSARAGEDLGLYPVLWTATRSEMEKHLRRFLAMDVAEIRAGGLRPVFFEEKLLSGTPFGFPLQGRLDRVDRAADGRVRVVDYKTKNKSKSALAKDVAEGKNYQPAVYLELVENDPRVMPPGARLDGAHFYFLEEMERTDKGLSPEEWQAARPAFSESLKLYHAYMSRGEFVLRPSDKCRWCAFSRLCRKSHGLSKWRAEHAPQAEGKVSVLKGS